MTEKGLFGLLASPAILTGIVFKNQCNVLAITVLCSTMAASPIRLPSPSQGEMPLSMLSSFGRESLEGT
jgi:hypothetical protein